MYQYRVIRKNISIPSVLLSVLNKDYLKNKS